MNTKTLNRIYAVMICTAAAVMPLSGCGDAAAPTGNTASAEDTADAAADTSENNEDAKPSEDSSEAAENPFAEYNRPADDFTIESSVDMAAALKLGWNLGNTLDATGSGTGSEISWGQPKTTKEMIDFVRDSGFTTIRIPVSWGNHVGSQNYNIDVEWMNRVNEVVNYAIDDGLYVIINSHHDCDYYYPSEEKFEEGEQYLISVWTQIAERFKDYGEHLIFESMNEPRLMNTSKEWWFSANDPDGIASIECIVKHNQTVVDTIRATGGNNAKRWIMVPSNAASPDNALNDAFTMPTDSAGRVMLSVHAYTPYDFAMNKNGYTDWDGSHLGDITGFMDRLDTKFVQNGYGVVIGEFGSTNKDNLEARVAWADDYTKAASEHKMSCILWDNGGTKVGEENFGMIDRKNLAVYYPEILEAYLKNYR